MSLFHRIAKDKLNASGNRLGFWGAVLALGLLFLLVEFSYTQFSLTRQLLGQNSPEGATAGWWWSLSVMWLISALRPRTDANVGIRRGLGHPGFHVYLVASFTLLSVMEIVQQGAPAASGFLIGAGAFAAVFMLVDLGMVMVRKIRLQAPRPIFESDQLPLPF